MIDEKLRPTSIERLQMKRWKFYQAFPQSDIIWEDFTKDSVISNTKTVILWVFLILLSVILITPVMIVEYLQKFEASLDLSYKLINRETVEDYTKSLAAMLVSIILIPFFLDMMVLMEDFRTKSQRQLALLNRNFIFMLTNMLFLNLTGLTTIKAFLFEVEKQEVQTWPQFLA